MIRHILELGLVSGLAASAIACSDAGNVCQQPDGCAMGVGGSSSSHTGIAGTAGLDAGTQSDLGYRIAIAEGGFPFWNHVDVSPEEFVGGQPDGFWTGIDDVTICDVESGRCTMTANGGFASLDLTRNSSVTLHARRDGYYGLVHGIVTYDADLNAWSRLVSLEGIATLYAQGNLPTPEPAKGTIVTIYSGVGSIDEPLELVLEPVDAAADPSTVPTAVYLWNGAFDPTRQTTQPGTAHLTMHGNVPPGEYRMKVSAPGDPTRTCHGGGIPRPSERPVRPNAGECGAGACEVDIGTTDTATVLPSAITWFDSWCE